jgi:hypothetical protein
LGGLAVHTCPGGGSIAATGDVAAIQIDFRLPGRAHAVAAVLAAGSEGFPPPLKPPSAAVGAPLLEPLACALPESGGVAVVSAPLKPLGLTGCASLREPIAGSLAPLGTVTVPAAFLTFGTPFRALIAAVPALHPSLPALRAGSIVTLAFAFIPL